MSNKSQLKTNNTQIQSLTTQVQSIKDNVENMPSGSSSVAGINGIIEDYEIAPGYTVNAGDFVEFTSSTLIKPSEITINGVAKENGMSGETIKVFVPS